MKQFIFLADTEIHWDIISLYIGGWIITLVILYHLIKAAVKNGIIEARGSNEPKRYTAESKSEHPATAEQTRLQQRYDKGEITFEEYRKEWNK